MANQATANRLVIAKQGGLFVGGRYYETKAGGRIMAGQSYVEYQIPANLTQPYPIVIIPGGGQGASCFTVTPDGRDGWAQYFLGQGYAVYIMDPPGRGRSVHHPEVHGKLTWSTAERVSRDFTAPERHKLYPQASRHSQWPGSGLPGDPVFDTFFASQLNSIADRDIIQHQNQDAGVALLDTIGPAILMTHSQSGSFGWLIADQRPDLVKAIVAVEPGCPVGFIEPKGPPDWFDYSGVERDWGLASIPLTFDPPVAEASELKFVLQDEPDGPALARTWRQAEPARKLVNLAGIAVAIISSEASFHTPYDLGTSLFLHQAGVDNSYIQLADHGIHGNGHMMMLEKNSDEIAALIVKWLKDKA